MVEPRSLPVTAARSLVQKQDYTCSKPKVVGTATLGVRIDEGFVA